MKKHANLFSIQMDLLSGDNQHEQKKKNVARLLSTFHRVQHGGKPQICFRFVSHYGEFAHIELLFAMRVLSCIMCE